jgi:hypothetical protein
MQYRGDGRPLTEAGLHAAGDALGVAVPAIWAVLSIETRGVGFLRDRRPRVLFERHVFHRLTAGRFDAVRSDLSTPLPGGYAGAAYEWPRLEAAMVLDRDAALQSTSWGIGQLMGCNFALAGFANVAEMIAAMVIGEDAQLRATAAFIAGAGLGGALQQRDWAVFARGYNGPDFERRGYDRQLAAAFERNMGVLPDLRVRTAQVALFFLGFNPGPIDGFVGPRTRAAVVALQRKRGLPVTGELRGSLADAVIAEAWP